MLLHMRTEWELYAPGMYISTLPINNHTTYENRMGTLCSRYVHIHITNQQSHYMRTEWELYAPGMYISTLPINNHTTWEQNGNFMPQVCTYPHYQSTITLHENRMGTLCPRYVHIHITNQQSHYMRTEWELYAPGMYISTLPINNHTTWEQNGNFTPQVCTYPHYQSTITLHENRMGTLCPRYVHIHITNQQSHYMRTEWELYAPGMYISTLPINNHTTWEQNGNFMPQVCTYPHYQSTITLHMRTEWELYAPGMYISTLPINNHTTWEQNGNFMPQVCTYPHYQSTITLHENRMGTLCPRYVHIHITNQQSHYMRTEWELYAPGMYISTLPINNHTTWEQNGNFILQVCTYPHYQSTMTCGVSTFTKKSRSSRLSWWECTKIRWKVSAQ